MATLIPSAPASAPVAPGPGPGPGPVPVSAAISTPPTPVIPTPNLSDNSIPATGASVPKTSTPAPPRPSERQLQRTMPQRTLLENVQRKWQMASCAHFLHIFKSVIPLRDISQSTFDSLTPSLLETAIATPDQSTEATLALRDVLQAFLVALDVLSLQKVSEVWFRMLRVHIVEKYPTWFPDCFRDDVNQLNDYEDGMTFLVSADWSVRLGLLSGLCDLAAEEALCVRDFVRDAEIAQSKQGEPNRLDSLGIRLKPIGRCSRRRTFYNVGATRVYSGYKRKGTGTLLVECSNSDSMRQLVDALDGSEHQRDHSLASEIRGKYLGPLIELEERERRRLEKRRQEEIMREESRRRNSSRPRRKKASYL